MLSCIKNFLSISEKTQNEARADIEQYLNDPMCSTTDLANKLTEATNIPYNRKTAMALVNHLGYPQKDKKLVNLSKKLKPQVKRKETSEQYIEDSLSKIEDKEQFARHWILGMSYSQIEAKHNVTQYEVEKLLPVLKLQPREKAYNLYSLEQDLLNAGYSKKDIEQIYIGENISTDELAKKVSKLIQKKVSGKIMYNLVRHWEIEKPEHLIRYRQGAKSRNEFAENMEKLSRAGLNSLQELADYYSENKSITYAGLLNILNSNLLPTDYEFTIRWLDRHMSPLLPVDKLGGISRVELEMVSYIKEIAPNKEIFTSYRQLIPPQEVDVYLPNEGIAIEFNGDYWHSDRFMLENHLCTAEEYHRLKQEACSSKGVDLFFVWESDWMKNTTDIKEALRMLIWGGHDDPCFRKLTQTE